MGGRLKGELLGKGGRLEEELSMRASVSREEGWKESFFFQGGNLEGELLFPGRKVGRRASFSSEEIWKESFCFHGERLEGDLFFQEGRV